MTLPTSISALLSRGVRLVAPETVSVGPDVVPDRIAPGVIIHPGCRLDRQERRLRSPRVSVGSTGLLPRDMIRPPIRRFIVPKRKSHA